MSHVEAIDIKLSRVQSNKTSHFMCPIPLPCYYMQLNMSKNVDTSEWWFAKTELKWPSGESCRLGFDSKSGGSF